MQITVTGRHIDVTDTIRTHVNDRVDGALGEFPRVESVRVVLDVQKHRHLAELVVQAKNHITVDAHHESDDLYTSIDSAVDKAQRQLRKLRDKATDHKSRDNLSTVDLEMNAKEGAPPEA